MKKRMKKPLKNVFDKWLRGGGSDGHSPTGPKRALGPEASDTYEKMHETYEKSQGKICRSKSNSLVVDPSGALFPKSESWIARLQISQLQA